MGDITVLIVDDHAVVRDGLKAIFAQKGGYTVVDEAANGSDALASIEKKAPDIVLLDVHMPELGGLDVIERIIALAPSTKIVILTMYDRGKYVASALQSGASAYVLKEAGIKDIFSAIKSVLNGGTFLSERINQIVVRDFARSETPSKYISCINLLTEREREVFQLVISGLSTKEIAEKLNISTKTVEHHRSKIMHKLGCTSIQKLVLLAVREGYVLE